MKKLSSSRDNAGTTQTPRGDGPSPPPRAVSGTSVGRFGLASFLVFALVLIGALYMIQYELNEQFYARRHLVASSIARQEAARIAALVSAYQQSLGSLASNPAVHAALRSGDRTRLTALTAEYRYLFPDVAQVRMLPADLDNVLDTLQPALSFAGQDLVRQTLTGSKPPPAEAHVMGPSDQHFDLAHAVRSADGKQVLGIILVSMNDRLLRTWLEGVQSHQGYYGLSQVVPGSKALLLAEIGTRPKDGNKFATPVPGTRWRLAVDLPTPGAFSPNLRFWIVYIVAVALAGVLIFLLFRTVSRLIKADTLSLMRLIRDVLQDSKRYEQPLRLKEFRSAALMVKRMPKSTTLDRERDDLTMMDPLGLGATTGPGASSAGPASLYLSSTGMSVEEVDGEEFRVAAAAQQMAGHAPTKGTTAPRVSASAPAPASVAGGDPDAPPPPEIFKAYDIRGIVGQSLTTENIYLIGRALGSQAAEAGVETLAFGRDGRLSGPELGGALVRGLRDSGRRVIDVGQVPTPLLYYTAVELAGGSGVMLTGSHNPPDYNGLKMMLAGDTLAGERIQALRERIVARTFTTGKGEYQTAKVIEPYIKRVVTDVKLKRPLKVVVDCGNGVAGVVAPRLLKALGCDVTELFCDVDGRFPNHHPDPSQPQNLRDLIRTVGDRQADLGLAFDGDGDRLGVISSDGSIIWPDRQMMLYATDVLARNPGATILFDVKCSTNLARVISEHGGRALMWKTGHSLVKAKMKEIGAPLGGEMSGHIFFKERWYGFDDALYTAARLLEILTAETRSPQAVFAALPDALNTPELHLDMVEGEHHAFMERMLLNADFGQGLVNAIDGLRVDYEDGWGLVRASNTTPCLVLRFEGVDEAALKRVQDVFRTQMLALEPGLKLPF